MHISVICDLDACIYDAGFFRYEPTDKAILGVGCIYDATEILSPTNEQGDSRSRMPQINLLKCQYGSHYYSHDDVKTASSC